MAARQRLNQTSKSACVPDRTLANCPHMPVPYRYRGRVITPEDILFLRQFIAENPHLSRRRLSAKVCEVWDWKQANGALRDMVCRGLLLMLHRAGEIELPQVRFVARNP